MPPRTPPLYTDFFCETLTGDVESLLGRFQDSDSVRFEVFSALWRDSGFSDVFLGLPCNSELRRFCRIALSTAVKYFLPPYGYQVRVGGLYLLYGLFHTQLCFPPMRARLALKDWADVQRFVRESADAQHYDVLYIYRKLLSDRAFHFTAMPHLLVFRRQLHTKKGSAPEPRLLSRCTAVRELVSEETLEELTNIQSHYEQLKRATQGVRGEVSTTLPDFTDRLKKCMFEYSRWQEKAFPTQTSREDPGDDEEEKEEQSCSQRARLLSAIKQKSYSSRHQQAPPSRRHHTVELMDESSSEDEKEKAAAAAPQLKKQLSLRARTLMSLGGEEEEEEKKKTKTQGWLLTIPEELETGPVKKYFHLVPPRLK